MIGEAGGNLIDVAHLREAYGLQVRETGFQLVIETRGREHAQKVLDAVRDAGYDVRLVAGLRSSSLGALGGLPVGRLRDRRRAIRRTAAQLSGT